MAEGLQVLYFERQKHQNSTGPRAITSLTDWMVWRVSTNTQSV
jgi:hypothetical protein